MQRALIIGVLLGATSLAGCSSTVDAIMEKLPVYKIDVQQGNVVTQEAVDRLRPGMEKRQVRFLLGTPLLEDVFHDDRWDYYYSFKPGGEDPSHERLSVFFEDDRLVRLSGDFMPNPDADPQAPTKESLVVVPVLPPKELSYWQRFLNIIGFEDLD
ncbi:MAG: outer membrane protein assembly factor BamE [Chromatiales bacterium]|nr:outer membrane protein assembly factor BamE [Chromatiales bacterium]